MEDGATILIRAFEEKDIPAMSRIHAESWRTAYRGIVPRAFLDGLSDDFWVPAFRSFLRDGIPRALVLFKEDEPVGCVCFGPSRDESLQGWGEIVSLYVLPDCEGRGFGTMLLDAALAGLAEDGFDRVYLWVLEKNERARRFYERRGLCATKDVCAVEIEGERLQDVRYILCREDRDEQGAMFGVPERGSRPLSGRDGTICPGWKP